MYSLLLFLSGVFRRRLGDRINICQNTDKNSHLIASQIIMYEHVTLNLLSYATDIAQFFRI